MLGIAPPGYNAPSMNSQAVTGMGSPGQQTVHGAASLPPMPSQYGAYYRSSYAAPSSMSMPSSIPFQQQYYGPPPDALAEQQKASMVNALKGAS